MLRDSVVRAEVGLFITRTAPSSDLLKEMVVLLHGTLGKSAPNPEMAIAYIYYFSMQFTTA